MWYILCIFFAILPNEVLNHLPFSSLSVSPFAFSCDWMYSSFSYKCISQWAIINYINIRIISETNKSTLKLMMTFRHLPRKYTQFTMKHCSLVVRNKTFSETQQNIYRFFHLAKGDILPGPEVMVPVLCVLPQMSEFSLQHCLILRDVVYDRPQVWQFVWWPDPVIFRCWSWDKSGFL